jgi:hypothetical protein
MLRAGSQKRTKQEDKEKATTKVGALGVCERRHETTVEVTPQRSPTFNMKVSLGQSKIGIGGEIRKAKWPMCITCITCIKHGGFGVVDADTGGPVQSDRSEPEHISNQNLVLELLLSGVVCG